MTDTQKLDNAMQVLDLLVSRIHEAGVFPVTPQELYDAQKLVTEYRKERRERT